MKKLAICDSDGTLFDSMPEYTQIFCDTLEEIGIPKEFGIEIAEAYNKSAGMSLDDQYFQMLTKYKKDTSLDKDLVQEFFSRVRKIEMEEGKPAQLFPDVKDFLEQFYGKINFVISSGTETNILNERIEKAGISKYIDLALGKNNGNKESHVVAAKKHYGFGGETLKKKAVYIGDGEKDMKLAKKLGMTAIGRIGTTDAESLKRAGADYTVESFSELPQILELI